MLGTTFELIYPIITYLLMRPKWNSFEEMKSVPEKRLLMYIAITVLMFSLIIFIQG